MSRTIVTSSDAEVRREVTDTVLTTYYYTLVDLYRKRNKAPAYSFDEVSLTLTFIIQYA